MKKGVLQSSIVVGIIVLFVGANILPSTLGTIKEKTVSTGFGSRGYIQGLIDNASDGDTVYVPSGIYYERIIINKSISLIGEDKNTTIIDGNCSGDIVTIVSDRVNISGFTIQRGVHNWAPMYCGMRISSRYNNISDNILTKNEINIWIDGNSSTIVGNTISRSGALDGYIGIYIFSNNNTINDNIITGIEETGIQVSTNKNIISGNIITGYYYGSTCGISITGGNNIIFENTITNHYWESIRLSGENNTISGNTITNTYWFGVYLTGENNTISGNNITNNTNSGIRLFENSDYNNIINNTIANNIDGVFFDSSNSNTIKYNTISNNEKGIHLHSSNSNNITDNTIINNGIHGIYFNKAYNNTVSFNTIKANEQGIYLENSSNNTILKNNLLNNNQDAFFNKSKQNTWNRNYWNRPRILPKLIFGTIQIRNMTIPWFNIDWRPAFLPYDIA